MHVCVCDCLCVCVYVYGCANGWGVSGSCWGLFFLFKSQIHTCNSENIFKFVTSDYFYSNYIILIIHDYYYFSASVELFDYRTAEPLFFPIRHANSHFPCCVIMAGGRGGERVFVTHTHTHGHTYNRARYNIANVMAYSGRMH